MPELAQDITDNEPAQDITDNEPAQDITDNKPVQEAVNLSMTEPTYRSSSILPEQKKGIQSL